LFLPAKIFWLTPGKSTNGPSLEKILSALMFRGTCSSIDMLKGHMDEESLGTPALACEIFFLSKNTLQYSYYKFSSRS